MQEPGNISADTQLCIAWQCGNRGCAVRMSTGRISQEDAVQMHGQYNLDRRITVRLPYKIRLMKWQALVKRIAKFNPHLRAYADGFLTNRL